jgi:hypothetical protein
MSRRFVRRKRAGELPSAFALQLCAMFSRRRFLQIPRRSRPGSPTWPRRSARRARPAPSWRCRACYGVRPPRNAESPTARRGEPGRRSGAAPRRTTPRLAPGRGRARKAEPTGGQTRPQDCQDGHVEATPWPPKTSGHRPQDINQAERTVVPAPLPHSAARGIEPVRAITQEVAHSHELRSHKDRCTCGLFPSPSRLGLPMRSCRFSGLASLFSMH